LVQHRQAAPLKTKGDAAELIVAADLVELARVQVKYTESDGTVVSVRCPKQTAVGDPNGGRVSPAYH
jgi:hypothetical protein